MKRFFLIVGVLIMVLLKAGWTLASPDYVSEGTKRLDEGRFGEAIQCANAILERRPGHLEALKIRALAESGLGRFDEAVADYESLLDKNPSDAPIHRDLGMLLVFKKKETRHALLHLDRYLSLTNRSFDSPEVERTARLMQTLDRPHTAMEVRAMKDLLDMARSFERAGNAHVAVETYERILKISPTCSACHEALGRLLDNKGRSSEEAKVHREKAQLFGVNG
ncbi:MAG TPA: tetratricopeptide repeat protein [bacterium]|nr:tetratricopeptide repeat protein [bacterium]